LLAYYFRKQKKHRTIASLIHACNQPQPSQRPPTVEVAIGILQARKNMLFRPLGLTLLITILISGIGLIFYVKIYSEQKVKARVAFYKGPPDKQTMPDVIPAIIDERLSSTPTSMKDKNPLQLESTLLQLSPELTAEAYIRNQDLLTCYDTCTQKLANLKQARYRNACLNCLYICNQEQLRQIEVFQHNPNIDISEKVLFIRLYSDISGKISDSIRKEIFKP